MSIRRIALLASLLCLLTLGSTTGARAQDYPGTTAGPVCGGDALSGSLIPGGVGNVTGVCVAFEVGTQVDLVINSTPIVVPAVPVKSDKSATWNGFAVPRDFELNAFHTAVSRDSTGSVVLSGRFFVDRNGRITSGPSAGSSAKRKAPLARTGSNSTQPLVKGAAVLLAAGGITVLAAKKRRSRTVRA